jgi:hypothetical protein
MTGGWLRQTEPHRRPPDCMLGQQRVQYPEQIQIEMLDIHAENVIHPAHALE